MRLARTWILFGLCLSVVLAAMGWISLTVLRLEQAQAEALRRAQIEENVRLALWRMDSALTPIIAQETARPHFVYSPFYAVEKAYVPIGKKNGRGGILIPSPLLTRQSDFVRLHFQFEPDGTVSSPQVPTGNQLVFALDGYVTKETLKAPSERLATLRSFVERDALMTSLPKEDAPVRVTLDIPPVAQLDANAPDAQGAQQSKLINTPEQILDQQRVQQANRGKTEWLQRQTQVGNAPMTYKGMNPNVKNVKNRTETIMFPSGEGEGVMTPLWVEDFLLLARRVSIAGDVYVQGCWLDWDATRTWMAELIRDLLPQADLEPVTSAAASGEERMLAALPVRLTAGPVPPPAVVWMSAVQMSLLVAWICVLAGAAAVGLLLHGAVSLGERRGAFVSAVTHELRTPLTTFRMYSEMLERGMVEGEEKRRGYLKTLCTEAERLSHLVENVLAYARLEKRGTTGRVETVALREVLDRLGDRLTQRAEQSGMTVTIDASDGALDTNVRADVSAVDQVLFNLVDNASKYARSAADTRIHIGAEATDGSVSISVTDHGPGIGGKDVHRLFRPFSKSAHDAAESAPGVGLGLALSRRLARSMGGDLSLDASVRDGASFVLRLPAA